MEGKGGARYKDVKDPPVFARLCGGGTKYTASDPCGGVESDWPFRRHRQRCWFLVLHKHALVIERVSLLEGEPQPPQRPAWVMLLAAVVNFKMW